jgi:hypothetical protein
MYQTIRKKPILSGTTPQLSFQIVNESGDGFVPDVVTMSVYDVTYPASDRCSTTGGTLTFPDTATHTIINGRNDVDVLSSVDGSGNLAVTLLEADTLVTVPTGRTPYTYQRRITFRWEWDSDKVEKHEFILTIAPDRETVAS